MLVELLIVFTVISLLYRRWVKRDMYRLGRELNSGVPTLPFLGHSYLFLGNAQTRMKAFQILGQDALKKDNGLSSMWHGSYLYSIIANPEAAQLVLKTCLEKDDMMKMATLFIGNGSIFSSVSIWRPRRKVLNPCFSIKSLKQFMSIFVKHSEVLVQQLRKVAGTGTMSAWSYLTAYTMDVIADTTLGYQMNTQMDSSHPFLKVFDFGLAKTADRVCQPWLHSDLVYTNMPVYTKLIKYKRYLWDFIDKLIKLKRKEIAKRSSKHLRDNAQEDIMKTFIEMLIKYSGDNEGYTDLEVTEESVMIMVAGNDTSAVGTCFTSVMLSRYPEVQENVYNELLEVFGDSDRQPSFEDLPRLKYLEAVIKETLRLYPPVPLITRKVEQDVILPSGIRLVPGTGVIVNIWALHRNPRYWGDDAEEFRPERFIDTPLKHPAAFMPFSYGPRNCVGYQFAMTSMKIVLSTLMRHYKILPATAPESTAEHPPLRLTFDLMMKDVDKFKIQLELRK